MPEKENQRIKLTKLLLKNSLIHLMNTKPLNKISIKELCENAGINRSTFYLYYTDQYTLLADIEEEILQHTLQHIVKMDSNFNTIQNVDSLLAYIESKADIFKPLICNPDHHNFRMKFMDIAIGQLKINLALKSSEAMLSYVYDYLTMGSMSLIKRWIESDFDISHKELATLLFKLSNKASSNFV